MDKIRKTKSAYGFLWTKIKFDMPERCHFDEMQELIAKPIVQGKIGIDIGSGCGFDTYTMAINNPSTKILSLDISDGIYKVKELTLGLKNVFSIQASTLEIPIKDNTLDFAYSFGVLHHTPNPEKGIREIFRVLKRGAPIYLYLYEDHSDNFAKHLSIKIVKIIRAITTRMPPKILFIFSYLASPFIVIIFSIPSRMMRKFKITRHLADKMPFNFGTHLFSLAGDLYDRFSVSIEYRFSRKEVFDLLCKNNYSNIKVDRLKSIAGWVIWGNKK